LEIKKIAFSRIPFVIVLILLQVSWFAYMLIKLTNELVWINVSLQVLSLIMLFVIIDKKYNSAYKLAWVIPVLVFPIFGGLLFLLFGWKKPAGKMRKKMNQSWNEVSGLLINNADTLNTIDKLDKTAAGQVRYIENGSKYPVHSNTVTKYYKSGEEMFPDMLEALESAKHYIFIEYYIISLGTMWKQILDILIEKAKAGADVRIIYDDFGCMERLPFNYKAELAQYNIKCVVFNPVVPVLSTVMNHRDHRKIMVIDGYIGFTGGINIADEYINEVDKIVYWKDTGIMLAGEAVHNLTVMFLSTWNSYDKTDEDMTKYNSDYHFKGAFQQDGFVQPYADSPLDDECVAEKIYLNIINMAVDYVYFFTPYLIIDNELVTSLCLASKRGVDVRIITSGIPDKKIVFCVTQSYYKQLADAEIRIYQFTPGFMHANCFVCDEKIATVGTVNMDYRSLYLHFECGVYLFGSQAVKSIREDFLETMEKCTLVNESLLKRNLPMRLFQSVLRLFSPMM